MKALIALVFLIIVGSFAVSSRSCCQHELQIANDLKADADLALKARKDFSDVTAEVHQLDVVLRGVVPPGLSASALQEVQQALRAGRVISFLEESTKPTVEEVASATSAPPSEVFFQRQGDQLILRGRVASVSTKALIGDSARKIPTIRRVVNGIELSDNAPRLADADAMAQFGRTFMSQTDEGYVQWSENQLVFRGDVRSHAVKTMLEYEAVPLARHLSLANELKVVDGPNTGQANLHCLVRTTNRGMREGVLRGTLPSDELCQATMEAAIRSTPKLKWSSELRTSPASQDAAWTPNAPGFVTAFLNEARDLDRGFLLRSKSIRVLNAPQSDQRTRIGLAAQELLGHEVHLTFDDSASPADSGSKL